MPVALQHLDFFLVVNPTEELSLFDNVQIALLEANAADDANEAAQMEDVVAGAHHQLFGRDALRTAEAFLYVQSAKRAQTQYCCEKPFATLETYWQKGCALGILLR